MIESAVLSTSPQALAELQATDYSIPVTLEEALNGTAKRRPRVYADGVFDLCHFGHARMFKQIKEMIPDAYTIAGMVTQEDTIRFKGKPVMTEQERTESMLHCRYVDEVIPHVPWDTTWEFMSKHKLDFMAHDALPYHQSEEGSDPYKKFKDAGRFVATRRTEDISTTDLIGRIVADHDGYTQRYANGAAAIAVQNGLPSGDASEKLRAQH